MIINVIEAVNDIETVDAYKCHNNVFLAGGITNCPDWQSEVIEHFKNTPGPHKINVYNPRRSSFDMSNPNETEKQILWEYQKLDKCRDILFWFSEGSLNPISLYELGRWGFGENKNIFIGIHPNYARAKDVIIQSSLSGYLSRPFYNTPIEMADAYLTSKARSNDE